jgi:hypothetical protein
LSLRKQDFFGPRKQDFFGLMKTIQVPEDFLTDGQDTPQFVPWSACIH